MTLLEAAGWDALAYKVNMDWSSTVIFFVTFLVVGGLNLTYLLTLAWKSGQTKALYTPGVGITRVGSMAILSLVLWVVGYFTIGITVLNN